MHSVAVCGQVGEDGRVSQFMKVKLSVSASSVRETGLREVRRVESTLVTLKPVNNSLRRKTLAD